MTWGRGWNKYATPWPTVGHSDPSRSCGSGCHLPAGCLQRISVPDDDDTCGRAGAPGRRGTRHHRRHRDRGRHRRPSVGGRRNSTDTMSRAWMVRRTGQRKGRGQCLERTSANRRGVRPSHRGILDRNRPRRPRRRHRGRTQRAGGRLTEPRFIRRRTPARRMLRTQESRPRCIRIRSRRHRWQ